MKTCVVRRRFWATEADNATVDVDLEPGFGIPKGVVIFYVENNAATDAFDTTLGFRNFGVGFCGAGSTIVCNIGLQDGVTTTASHRSHFTSRFISASTSDRTTATHYRVDTLTFLNDRIRLAFLNQTPQTNGHLDTLIWAVTGDDVTVGVGISSFSTTTGTTRLYSQLAFQPDFVLVASINTTSAQTISGDAIFSLGAATRSPLKQSGVGWFYANAATTINTVIRESDSAITQLPATGGAVVSAAISNITTGGWTMTNTGGFTANTAYNFFAIKGFSPSDFAILDINTPTTTGVNFTGLGSTGFVPETVLGMSTFVQTRNATQTTGATGSEGFSVFAGTATSFSKLYNGDGTATYSTVSTTVTGTGSTFWKLNLGDRLYTTGGDLIGTVSTVSSATSLTLTANAALNGTGVNYATSTFRQGSVSIGDSDGFVITTNQNRVYSQMSSRLYNVPRALLTNPVQGYLDLFDTRPGLQINYTAVNAAATFGWLAAFKSTDANRRRGIIS